MTCLDTFLVKIKKRCGVNQWLSQYLRSSIILFQKIKKWNSKKKYFAVTVPEAPNRNDNMEKILHSIFVERDKLKTRKKARMTLK